MRSFVLGGLLAAMLALAPRSTRAQEAGATHATPPEALELFRTARDHYREGRYPQAAADLERALILDPTSPTLRYNLGRVYELLGELPEARREYARYLELLPADDVEERERTEATIQRLDGAIASGIAAPPPVPARVQEPLRELTGPVLVRERGVADLAFWVTGGAGLAALLVAAITGGVALDRASARDNLVLTAPGQLEAYHAQRDGLDADARALGITTDVLLGVGGAALIATLLLFVLREHEVEREIVHDEQASAIAPLFATSGRAALIGIRGAL